jgi:hypothetical protein
MSVDKGVDKVDHQAAKMLESLGIGVSTQDLTKEWTNQWTESGQLMAKLLELLRWICPPTVDKR